MILTSGDQTSEEEALLLPILIGEHEARWWKRNTFKIMHESSVFDHTVAHEMVHFRRSFAWFAQAIEIVQHRFIAGSRNEAPILRIAVEKGAQCQWTSCCMLIETHLFRPFKPRSSLHMQSSTFDLSILVQAIRRCPSSTRWRASQVFVDDSVPLISMTRHGIRERPHCGLDIIIITAQTCHRID